ncbi:hypothetical protein A2634_01550 [Candidatus Amesbacteria bacterium RIFCSPHIGHO2_01_FULL_48_32]|uniref:SpoVT-AbrB domain-containing protein n=1 Tax=Candidatus Amesbacteria bacterium RIFCSPLOWO2_01_FULL_48_25 TaxID=1797259 RepID=A0A1F4ZDC6_9BACT|nr:MAG: hypothetical protein A2634_01550 [Candidatus Amesbacteria bacterium RIFCSPHIGHO2_01_FULL_48_32]OGD03727.1 MAG: hypothetical protein A2989_03535 [Candidatus Amesbacteria bacterium RIFCSPLOWO2_01_FULL_48_25]HJZ05925.1 hypothetical protein [Patescibacteria group bacterium]
MDDVIVMLQPRGQITVPRRFRVKYGFGQGPVRVRDVGGGVMIEPVTILKYRVRRYSDQEVDEFLKLDEKESRELKNAGII